MADNPSQFVEVVPVTVGAQIFLDRFDHFVIAHTLFVVALHCAKQLLQEEQLFLGDLPTATVPVSGRYQRLFVPKATLTARICP